MPRTFVIDTDTGSDDAVAILMALRYPDVHVAGITAVHGNVPLHQALANALYSVEVAGANVPVWAGADRPLLKQGSTAQPFHGNDGLGDQGYGPPRRTPQPGHGADALVKLIRDNPGLTLVTLGPLTNVALAISRAPDIVDMVERCVVMGGAANTVGNITPAAEFNIWVDPDAAAMVFRSGLAIEMVGWELCRDRAALAEPEYEAIRAIGTPTAEFAVGCQAAVIKAMERMEGKPSITLPDPVAMAIALEPSICTRSSTHLVEVETVSELTRGMTVVDQLDVAARRDPGQAWELAKPVTVCWEIDIPRWKALLRECLS